MRRGRRWPPRAPAGSLEGCPDPGVGDPRSAPAARSKLSKAPRSASSSATLIASNRTSRATPSANAANTSSSVCGDASRVRSPLDDLGTPREPLEIAPAVDGRGQARGESSPAGRAVVSLPTRGREASSPTRRPARRAAPSGEPPAGSGRRPAAFDTGESASRARARRRDVRQPSPEGSGALLPRATTMGALVIRLEGDDACGRAGHGDQPAQRLAEPLRHRRRGGDRRQQLARGLLRSSCQCERRPGRLPVCSPSLMTKVPLTSTCSIPDGYWWGSLVRGAVADPARVEDHEVGPLPDRDDAPVLETETARRKSRHLVHRPRAATTRAPRARTRRGHGEGTVAPRVGLAPGRTARRERRAVGGPIMTASCTRARLQGRARRAERGSWRPSRPRPSSSSSAASTSVQAAARSRSRRCAFPSASRRRAAGRDHDVLPPDAIHEALAGRRRLVSRRIRERVRIGEAPEHRVDPRPRAQSGKAPRMVLEAVYG